MEILINLIKQNGVKIFTAIIKGVGSFGTIFVRPFFFSHKQKYIIAPYAYVFVLMILFFTSIGLFLFLCYEAAFKGIKDTATVLTALGGAIVTLMASTTLMQSAYNKGKDDGSNSDNDKPNGVQ